MALLDGTARIAPQAVGALAAADRTTLQFETRLALDDAQEDATPRRLLALLLAGLALAIHAAMLAPAPSSWPMAIGAAAALAMAVRAATRADVA